jgi:hypothetical protein
MDAKYHITPTMTECQRDPNFVRVLAGPIGSGKSIFCVHELVRMAMTQAPNAKGERKSLSLIVRNTADQLRSTTQRSFFDWFAPGVWGTYKVTDRTLRMDHVLNDVTRLLADFMFMPLDTPDDKRKALSLELTFLWCNEWRELHPEVVDALLGRLRRFPKKSDGGPTRSCALFDTNMPDMDTWHFHKMENPPANWSVFVQPPAILNYEEYVAQEPDEPDPSDAAEDINGDLWWTNPRADNVINLDPMYYPGNVPGRTIDYINVYLRCKYGRSLHGLPVYERTFNADFHIAKSTIKPLRSENYPIIVGLDFGRTPAAALMQRNAFGQLVVLDELTSRNMGIETFLATKLKPLLAEPRYLGCHVYVAPDPAGYAKQQIGEVSPVDIIKRAGLAVVPRGAISGANKPEARINAVESWLLRHVDGKPAFTINPECAELIRGFRYGYRYKLDSKGNQDPKPDKNEFSHVHDACQYACLVADGGHAGRLTNAVAREIEVVSAAGWT